MPRHRGKFNPANPVPYELSRYRVENFVQCPACFYIKQVEGIAFPSIPGFNINEATDVLLKRDFDVYRARGEPHPWQVENGLGHLVPFAHPDFEGWTQSLHFGVDGRFNTVHEPTNLKVGGGVDDVWKNQETGELHIVDYKSTSQKSAGRTIDLEGKWKAAYKRQMDLYTWVLRRKGFEVSETGYFLYVDGDRFTDEIFLHDDCAVMQFKTTLLPYATDTSWIEPTLMAISELLHSAQRPAHSEECEFGAFLARMNMENTH